MAVVGGSAPRQGVREGGNRLQAWLPLPLTLLGASSVFHLLGEHQRPNLCEQPKKHSYWMIPPGPWLSRGLRKATGVERQAGPNFGRRHNCASHPGYSSAGQAPRRPLTLRPFSAEVGHHPPSRGSHLKPISPSSACLPWRRPAHHSHAVGWVSKYLWAPIIRRVGVALVALGASSAYHPFG